MSSTMYIFSFFETTIFIIVTIFATIYAIPIIFTRRFHQPNNIFTLNVCVAAILCCLSWLPVYAAFMSDDPNRILEKIALVFTIAETIFTIQVPFSLVVASLHRYCSLVYHTKLFFKRKQWIILCISSQWILGFVLSIPNIVCLFMDCYMSAWPTYYTFASNVLIPLILFSIINLLIYHHVRSSTRRIQPHGTSENIQQKKLSQRDVVLLRHMALMFFVFIGGWGPTFLISILTYYITIDVIVNSSLTVWCELALLFDIIDLFLYNHELRKYLKDIFRQCFRL